MPVRKILPSGTTNTRGFVSSKKSIGDAMYESSLERDNLILLDFNPAVSSFEVQPVKIDMTDIEGHRQYTPDVLIHFEPGCGKPCLAEIKFEQDLVKDWPHLRAKFKAAIKLCREQGWVFHILTERHIRTPLLDNVKFLRDFRMYQCGNEALLQVAKFAAQPRSIASLQSCLRVFDPQSALPIIWHCLWHQLLVANLDSESLSMNTEVVWHGNK